ncbi:MAG: hypothetical protein J5I98_25040 [Phaeodactylibacter sp.]|nr:hypothetical protein [Phaeodactylibacter sp.]
MNGFCCGLGKTLLDLGGAGGLVKQIATQERIWQMGDATVKKDNSKSMFLGGKKEGKRRKEITDI